MNIGTIIQNIYYIGVIITFLINFIYMSINDKETPFVVLMFFSIAFGIFWFLYIILAPFWIINYLCKFIKKDNNKNSFVNEFCNFRMIQK